MSSTQSVIEIIAGYLETCPALLMREAQISVVPHELSTSGFYLIPSKKDKHTKKYIDGSTLHLMEYSFSSIISRMQKDQSYLYMFEQFHRWIEEQDIQQAAVFLETGIHAEALEVICPFHFVQQNAENIRYECILRLSFTKQEKLRLGL